MNKDNSDGCEPCECDPTESYSMYCDQVSGQCPCKPHVTGRRCDIPVSKVNSKIDTKQQQQVQQQQQLNPTETNTVITDVTTDETIEKAAATTATEWKWKRITFSFSFFILFLLTFFSSRQESLC